MDSTAQTQKGFNCPSLQTLYPELVHIHTVVFKQVPCSSVAFTQDSASDLCFMLRPAPNFPGRPATSYQPNQKSFIKHYFVIEDHNINCLHWHNSTKLLRHFPAPLPVLTSTLGVERVEFSHIYQLMEEKRKCLGVRCLAQRQTGIKVVLGIQDQHL